MATTPKATLIPTIRCVDAPRMLDWLCEAFGFGRHFVVPADDGGIAHAQLTFGNGMVMLGSHRDDEWGALVQPVARRGGASSGVYVVVPDVDAHCARAKAAGAEVLYGPRDTDYGSREYAARDPEGNVWSFGTYDPWT
jgi:uncharacterized glyoxalase superfamily protein PhnB